MNIEIWFTFVLAVITFCAIPGPTALLVIAQAMKNGKGSGIPMAIGVILGCLTSMTLSLVGLGAILMTSSTLFILFKWLGVGYLVYLGIKTFFEKTSDIEIDKNPVKLSYKKLIVSTYCVTTLNPKGIIFFVAFFPQFVEIGSSFYIQMLILVPTFVVILGSSILLYSLFAEKVGDKIKSVKARKKMNRIGGGALVGAGLITATIEK